MDDVKEVKVRTTRDASRENNIDICDDGFEYPVPLREQTVKHSTVGGRGKVARIK